MRTLYGAVALLSASAVSAASWSFSDATLTVQGKGTGVGGGLKEKLDPKSPLSKAVTLEGADSLKIVLTTTDGKKPARPHQAFLTIADTASGLEEAFPFSLKENGKGKVELTQRDIPLQLLASTSHLIASIVLGSFGASTPINTEVFQIDLQRDPSAPMETAAPVRYGKQPEIHHIFKPDPKSPNVLITIVFSLAIFATLPVLLGTWLTVGANFSHLPKAFDTAPAAHGVFFLSILALEGIFVAYYTSLNLFQTLPAVAVVGVVAFLSGTRALTEVQGRRLAGER
ncbi:hypothetical protein EV356DRAFT_455513 [Viridothelium virens]|uniref:Ribophorin II C-terminal domain-containing protein n=1 Tax=Viridothelium virens TaxID=1048519 RepID=A0A6A6GV65_VIRVR|nr:hypothetical protein EV356DRAFT_455513 [Viridothelium virens]